MPQSAGDAPNNNTSRIPIQPRSAPSARTIAIGDIHGCSRAFDLLLQQLNPGKHDTLVTLGDYVDRGPDSSGILSRLIELPSRTNLVPLMGNHEILMLDAREGTLEWSSWFGVGGRQTMLSYGTETPDWKSVPDEHWTFLKDSLHRWYATDDVIFAHANVNAMLTMPDQKDDWLFWRRFEDSHPHFSGKLLVCGHTAQKSGAPKILPSRICIDTWAYGDGWLTAYETGTEFFVQANQRGEVRRLSFEEAHSLSDQG